MVGEHLSYLLYIIMRLLLSSLVAIIAIVVSFYNREQLLPLLNSIANRSSINPSLSSHSVPSHTTMSASKPSSTFQGLPVIPPNDPSLNSNTSTPRKISKVFEATEQAEGAGARVRRSIGTPELRNFTPFLMLDNFAIAPGAGFPDHPHRGQETITYLLSGSVDHEDFAGNKGTIETGDLQFMVCLLQYKRIMAHADLL